MRVVQLSDLHLRRLGSHEEQVAEAVHHLAPDLLVLSGDMVDRSDGLPLLHSFLALLPSSSPTYAILGNWEHWSRLDLQELQRVYEAHRVRLLINETVRLEHHGVSLLVTGMDDATGGRPSLRRALKGAEPAANHLLLAHSPVYRDQLENESSESALVGRYAPQYMLAGHTHGGQINLLGWAPLRPPGSGRYVRGWYRDRDPHLYISQGLGTSVIPARFGAAPEIACFTWHLRA